MPAEILLAKVWGYDYRDEGHYVRLYVSYLCVTRAMQELKTADGQIRTYAACWKRSLRNSLDWPRCARSCATSAVRPRWWRV